MKINIGSGSQNLKGFVNIDLYKHKEVDIQIHIDKYGLPLKDNSVDYVYSSHFLEHIFNLDKIIQEMYRVSKNNCIIDIILPHFKWIPNEEHVREFNITSLKNYEINNTNEGYIKFLKHVYRKLEFKSRLLNFLFGNHPTIFEKFFPFRVFCKIHLIFIVRK